MKNWSFDILRLLQRSSAGGRLATPRSPVVSTQDSGLTFEDRGNDERCWDCCTYLILSPFQSWAMPTSWIWRQTQPERWSARYIPNILVVPKVLPPLALSLYKLYSFFNFTLRLQSIRMFGDLDSQYIGSKMATKVACLSCLSTHICHFPP